MYLLFDDHPAKKTPRGAIPNIAKANKTDNSGFAPYIPPESGIIPKIIIVDEITRNGASSKITLSARVGTMCSLIKNFIPSARFWKNPGKIVTPYQERFPTLFTISKSWPEFPATRFNQRFAAPIGLPRPNGIIFHHSPAVTPFSPTQRERRAVVAPRLSFTRA